MNDNKQQIMKHFAGVLRNRANAKAIGKGADLSLLKFLSRKELIEIIKNAHDGTLPKDLDLVELENKELLFHIKDEMFILLYFVGLWCKEDGSTETASITQTVKKENHGKQGSNISK